MTSYNPLSSNSKPLDSQPLDSQPLDSQSLNSQPSASQASASQAPTPQAPTSRPPKPQSPKPQSPKPQSLKPHSPKPQPSNSQAISPENLTRVRRNLTRRPQNSLADFKLRSTSYSLEVQFSQQRLRDCPIFNQKMSQSAEPGLDPIMVAATILLVGGSVALTHSTVFGILVAIALPTFWKLSTPSNELAQPRSATLRFVNTPNQRTVLSLTTAPASSTTNHQGRPIQRYLSPSREREATIHFSNIPVQLVSANTYLVGGQLCLTLYASDARGQNKLRITGKRKEIEWLHSRIDRWAKATAPQPAA